LTKYRKEILFNTKDIYDIIGIKKTDTDLSCLNLASVLKLANAHDIGLANWLNDAFTRHDFKGQTVTYSKINDDWTSIQ
jgi:hypothetical protein